VLTDDTSIDDDIMGEKIRPKDFVDDAMVDTMVVTFERAHGEGYVSQLGHDALMHARTHAIGGVEGSECMNLRDAS
jgi:hypothetical protein